MTDEYPIDPLADTNPVKPIDEPPIDPLADTNPTLTLDEPAIDPLADTNPSMLMRAVDLGPGPNAGWQRIAGALSLLGAAGFTVATLVLFLMPSSAPVPVLDEPTAVVDRPTTAPPTAAPTNIPQQAPVDFIGAPDILPTLSADAATVLLQGGNVAVQGNPLEIVRNPYNPFTLIPDRPRSEVIQYTIERGDTINGIAERFGISPETVVWANSRDIVGILPPGQPLNIMPVNGVYHLAVGTTTIAEIGAQYGIDDPFLIIDSEYNNLFGFSADDIPPSGTRIVIPGGEAEQINWNPTVVREGNEGGGGQNSGGNFITFAPGDPGSCGRVANPGGGAGWSNPLNVYTWIRGFTSFHTGVDLSASEGTPVQAANSGRVIFAGWNNWGYGYTIVLAHGPFTTLYGHLSSINVGCGQDVGVGQTIGAVGNSGNSSGAHLHFEIRFNDQPQDPTSTIPF